MNTNLYPSYKSLTTQDTRNSHKPIKTLTWHKLKTVRTRACALQESFYPTLEVPYAAVKKRMASLLGIVDRISVLSYLGRLEYRQKSTMEQTVTYRKSGTVVPKSHSFQRRIKGKKGYIELFDLGYLFIKNGEWFVHWNHKGLVNEVFFSRASQTRGECVRVAMHDLSLTNMDVGDEAHTTLKNPCDVSIDDENRERDTLGEREVSKSCVKQRKTMVEGLCVKSVKPRSSDGKWLKDARVGVE